MGRGEKTNSLLTFCAFFASIFTMRKSLERLFVFFITVLTCIVLIAIVVFGVTLVPERFFAPVKQKCVEQICRAQEACGDRGVAEFNQDGLTSFVFKCKE